MSPDDYQCQWCGVEFIAAPIRHDGELFCSRKCVTEYDSQSSTPESVVVQFKPKKP